MLQDDLFEFLMEFIDIQIKKYIALGQRGIGPDARINSTLVYKEVNELIDSAHTLIKNLDKYNPELVKNISGQIYFYLKCEGIRARAGYLLDKNNIHENVFTRVFEQKEQLKQIMRVGGVTLSQDIISKTEIQHACKYESCRIAIKILQLAKDIEENPEKEWDKELVPHHAQLALRKNAKEGRYREQANTINALYDSCVDSIRDMNIPEQYFVKMDGTKVEEYAVPHKNNFRQLLEQYKQLKPQSRLFSLDHQWYCVGKLQKSVEKPITANTVCSFFAKATIPLLVMGSLILYCAQAVEEINAPVFK